MLFGKDQSELGQLARDAQDIFRRIPVIEHRMFDSNYVEPMVIGQLAEEPFCIELVRLVNLSSPAVTPTAMSTLIYFTWLPSQGGAIINSIDGLTPGLTKYRFFFRVTYRLG